MQLVKLPTVDLANIPEMLRDLATSIEESPDTAPLTLVWIQYDESGEVTVGAFGDNPSKAEAVGLCMLAASRFTAESEESQRGASA